VEHGQFCSTTVLVDVLAPYRSDTVTVVVVVVITQDPVVFVGGVSVEGTVAAVVGVAVGVDDVDVTGELVDGDGDVVVVF